MSGGPLRSVSIAAERWCKSLFITGASMIYAELLLLFWAGLNLILILRGRNSVARQQPQKQEG
jgi:hypothetical protein